MQLSLKTRDNYSLAVGDFGECELAWSMRILDQDGKWLQVDEVLSDLLYKP